jgi:hypothetical protein
MHVIHRHLWQAGTMPPLWLTVLSSASASASFALAFATAAAIIVDILGRGYRQRMRVMEVVWPVTALYFGPFAWPFYRALGRARSPRWRGEHGEPSREPGWAAVALGASHCGAGCTLGDVIAEFVVFWTGLTVAGVVLPAEMVGDYVLALALRIAFQYFAIAPMSELGPRKALIKAAKADVLSLSAFEVGLFGWMALTSLVFFPSPHRHPNDPVYWFSQAARLSPRTPAAWPQTRPDRRTAHRTVRAARVAPPPPHRVSTRRR